MLGAVGCAPEPEGSDEPATFGEVRDDILMNSCAFSSCHGEGAGDLTLDEVGAYAALVDVPSSVADGEILVIPGDADGSYLVKKLEEADGIVGTLMPPSVPLEDAQIERIVSWIDAGAEDN